MHKKLIKKLQGGGINSTSLYKYQNQNNQSTFLPQQTILDANKFNNIAIKETLDLKLDKPKLLENYQPSGSSDLGKKGFLNGMFKNTKGADVANIAGNILNSLGPQLDNQSNVSKGLDIASNVASAFGPYGKVAGAVMKGVNFLDRITEKKSTTDLTSGVQATGYQTEINPLQGKTYGGLFGNRARRAANRSIRRTEKRNVAKIVGSTAALSDMTSGINSTQDIISKNQQALSGGVSTNIVSAKLGTKLNKLDNLRKLRKLTPIKPESKNIIPIGALHARRHEIGGEISKHITNKGIPVVSGDIRMEEGGLSFEKGGEITQHAEIETSEIIFRLELTKRIEEYLTQYNNTESQKEKDNICIEVGKLVSEEILENTIDNVGLLE